MRHPWYCAFIRFSFHCIRLVTMLVVFGIVLTLAAIVAFVSASNPETVVDTIHYHEGLALAYFLSYCCLLVGFANTGAYLGIQALHNDLPYFQQIVGFRDWD